MPKTENKITKTTIEDYLRCAFPAVAVESHEEGRLLQEIRAIGKLKGFENMRVVTISASQNLFDTHGDRENPAGRILERACTYPKAFAYVAEKPEHVLVVYDFQHIIKNGGSYRALKDQFKALKEQGSCVILVAPNWDLPSELTHDVPVLDFALPTRDQLSTALEVVVDSAKMASLKEDQKAACLDAASGLTLQEAENSFALSLSKTRRLEPQVISDEKMKLVRASGLLTIEPPPEVEPAGLNEYKRFVREEVLPVKDDPELRVKGILTVGVPGTGKTLFGRAIGQMLGWPVLGCDIGSLKAGIVGGSEANMRRMTKLAEGCAPCVLLFDEIEKGVGGHESSGRTDGGTTLGMVGHLLKWLQDQKGVLAVMTCNDYSLLPAPLARAGRIDAHFFVDLPTETEREEIAWVHLLRFGCDNRDLAAAVVPLSANWTGAEIEQLIKSAARRTRRQITPESLVDAARDIRPISKTKASEIEALRVWAKDSFRIANSLDAPKAEMKARKIR